MDDDEKEESSSSQQQHQHQQQPQHDEHEQLETTIRSYFPIGSTQKFPSLSLSSSSSDDDATASASRIINNNYLGMIFFGGRRDDGGGYDTYDPDYFNDLGQRLFCSQIKIEMNKYSKQYERISDDITSNVTEMVEEIVIVAASDKKEKEKSQAAPSEQEDEEADKIDWSKCDHHHIGALVLRGNRCVLIRSLQNEWVGMRLPSVQPMVGESPQESACRAIEYYTEGVDAKNECIFLSECHFYD